MAEKYYLDQDGVVRLVEYINDALDGKADVGSVPENMVTQADLADYALKSEIPESADLSAYATKAELEDYATGADLADLANSVTGVYHFRGSVADLAALQAVQSPAVGDVYNLEDTGMNAAWTGEVWDEFGSIVDLSGYLTENDVKAITIATLNSILYSGKSAMVSDSAGISAMLANDEPEVEITLNKDLSLSTPISVPEGKAVTLDLGGNDLSASAVAIVANGGDVVIKNGGVSSSNSDAVVVRNGGSVTVTDADIVSTRSNAISAREGTVTVNSGSVTSQEAGVLGLKDSTIVINGGTITGIDNGPLMGNGSAAGSANDGTNCNIVMNGGTLIAHIQTAGYIACGVYVPNSGSFTMNGGEIVSDGCGICMRGGTVNLNGGSIIANGTSGVTGKVGDSRVVVGPYAVVYDAQSKYPAVATLELNIAENMVLQGTDGDIQIVESTYEPNITDNRVSP